MISYFHKFPIINRLSYFYTDLQYASLETYDCSKPCHTSSNQTETSPKPVSGECWKQTTKAKSCAIVN